jgi:DNA mismatch repair protein MutS2
MRTLSSKLPDESLEPLYQLSVGQPGSSFTFEVAQINGIPQEIIEEAKTRLDANKVEMDKLIATLQKEKSEIELLNKVSKEAEASALEAKEESDALSEHYAERLQRQQQLIEKNNKDLSNGKKMGQFIQSYRMKGQNKPLLEEIRKFLAIEKSKLVKKKELAKVKKEEPITVPKPRPKEKKEVPKTPPKPVVVGSNVRMMNGSNKGEVIEIKGKEATVMFGIFKTKVKASELEVV